MCATRPCCYDLPCYAADLLAGRLLCMCSVHLMSGEKPVDQAVGCSGEHVYKGAAMAFVGDINGAYLLSIVCFETS